MSQSLCTRIKRTENFHREKSFVFSLMKIISHFHSFSFLSVKMSFMSFFFLLLFIFHCCFCCFQWNILKIKHQKKIASLLLILLLMLIFMRPQVRWQLRQNNNRNCVTSQSINFVYSSCDAHVLCTADHAN